MKTGARAGCLLALLGSSYVTTSAQGGERDSMPPVLRKALRVAATLRYTGRRTVTVLKDGQIDRHEEILLRDGPRVHIEFPDGSPFAGQVIVEDAKERRHFLPATNEVIVLPPRRAEGLQRLRLLARNGRVTTAPGDKIAGYPTTEVAMRDTAGNLVQRISIEPESGVVMRRRFYSPTGVESGGYVFTKIDLNPGRIDPALFKIERRGVQVITPWDQLKRLANKSGYSPVGLPATTGFRLDSVRLRRLFDNQVLEQTYIGPGGRLSLYQLHAAVSPARLRRQGKAGLNTLSWKADGETFVLVGPQAQATLTKLKASVGR